jgi:hypothetical protein
MRRHRIFKELNELAPVIIGLYPSVTLGKKLLNMIGNLV